MKKVKKFLISVVTILILFLFFNMNYMESNATFMSKAKKLTSGEPQIAINQVTDELIPIGQILTYVGAGVIVAVTAYLGVQYITSPPDKQGALKEKLIGVVASGVVIFGSVKIWHFVVNMVKDL